MKEQFLNVREIDTRRIIHSVDVSGESERSVDRVLRGMLINNNHDKYYITGPETTKPATETGRAG